VSDRRRSPSPKSVAPTRPVPPDPPTRSTRPAAVTAIGAVALAAGLAVAWWEGAQQRDSAAAHWSVGAVIALIGGLALATGWGRQRTSCGAWAGASIGAVRGWRTRRRSEVVAVAIWALLIVAVIGWDLASFVAQSHNLPTFSYLFGRITRWRWGRAVVFAAWVAIGSGLAVSCRRRGP
jgi:hypothetical protein